MTTLFTNFALAPSISTRPYNHHAWCRSSSAAIRSIWVGQLLPATIPRRYSCIGWPNAGTPDNHRAHPEAPSVVLHSHEHTRVSASSSLVQCLSAASTEFFHTSFNQCFRFCRVGALFSLQKATEHGHTQTVHTPSVFVRALLSCSDMMLSF